MSRIFKLFKNKIQDGWSEVNKSNISSTIELPKLNERFNPQTKIWRYLDFTKFISLLHYSNLFFTRLDYFYDQYEGDFMIGDLQSIYSSYDKFNVLSKELKEKINYLSRMGSFASCWHINEFENYGMWKSYLKTEEGVAIQTDVQSLRLSLNTGSKHSILIDKVTYIDYAAEKSMKEIYDRHVSNGKKITVIPAFFKNRYYEFENELRVVIFYELTLPPVEVLNMEQLLEIERLADPFIQAQINLETLIQNVYIHPDAPGWFSELVQSVLDKYNIKKPVLKSKLKKT